MKTYKVLASILESAGLLTLAIAWPGSSAALICIGLILLRWAKTSEQSLVTQFLIEGAILAGVSSLVFAVGVLASMTAAVVGGLLYAASVVTLEVFEGEE